MLHASRILAVVSALLIVAPAIPVSAQRMVPSPSARPPRDAIRMDMVVHRVSPEYPFEARRSRITGKGILVGNVDIKTGIVKSVRMEKSTGSRILDQAALSAFSQWRFKPGSTRNFRVPIHYTMGTMGY